MNDFIKFTGQNELEFLKKFSDKDACLVIVNK